MNGLAIDLVSLKEYEQAIQLLQQSLAIYKEIGAVHFISLVLANFAEGFIAMGNFANAVSYARESFLYSQNNPESLAWPNRTLGEALLGLGDLPSAREYFRKSLEVSHTLQEKCDVLLAIKSISVYLAAQGKGAKALELISLINHHPATWQWTKDRASELAAKLESELPQDVVMQAKERGRTRDLDATVTELLEELKE
jgi:tetratricopeptide (TPR) repeat protein